MGDLDPTRNRQVSLENAYSRQGRVWSGMPGHVLSPKNWSFACISLTSNTHASIGPLESSTQTVSQSIQPFLHSSWQSVPMLYNELLFPLKIATSHGGIWTSYNTHDFVGPSEPTTQMTSLLFPSFLHRRPQSVPILYFSPLKLPLPIGAQETTYFMEVDMSR